MVPCATDYLQGARGSIPLNTNPEILVTDGPSEDARPKAKPAHSPSEQRSRPKTNKSQPRKVSCPRCYREDFANVEAFDKHRKICIDSDED